MVLSIFSCVFHLYSSFEKCLFSSLAHFLIGSFIFLVLNCMSCLYIFEINSVSCFICYYFLPFWRLSFHLDYSFLRFAKAFKFNQVLFVYFFLLFTLILEVGHRGSCCDLCQRVFCLFSSRSFIVSGLTFRSLIHFELIFVYGVSVLVLFFYKWLTSFPSTAY